MLTFDEAGHRYFWNGKRVPNVTSIIAALTDYSKIPPDQLEIARQQGIQIHKMVELDCRGDLDLEHFFSDDAVGWMHGHYQGWLKFKADTGFLCWDSERRVYHHLLGYAGTLDLAGILPHLEGREKRAIIDVKRSLFGGPSIGLQTIGYQDARNAIVERDRRTERRFALVLRADGTYRLTEYDDHDDRAAFLACLQQLRWRAKHYPRSWVPPYGN